MPVQILQLPLGMLQTNCYIVADSDTNDAIIIDPSAEAEVILHEVQERGYTVREVIATHTHFDHVIAVAEVVEATGAPFRIHKDGLEQLKNLVRRAAAFGIQLNTTPPEPDGFIEHGDTVEVASIRLKARFTPGHSPGHLTFVYDDAQLAFVGDCVFMNSVGRTDIPGADVRQLKKSIAEQIMTLPDEYALLPGHGPVTTLERERQQNMILAQLLQMPD